MNEKHLNHLRFLEKKMKEVKPESSEWWDWKQKLEQVRIAYSQSFNLAAEVACREQREQDEVYPDREVVNRDDMEQWQSYFYDKLTEPLSKIINEKK